MKSNFDRYRIYDVTIFPFVYLQLRKNELIFGSFDGANWYEIHDDMNICFRNSSPINCELLRYIQIRKIQKKKKGKK